MKTYLVRSPQSENADGPFSLEQLRDLADSGVLTIHSLYNHDGMDGFEPFSENTALWDEIKPAVKASLKLKPKSTLKPSSAKTMQSAEAPTAESAKTARKTQPEKEEAAPSPYEESADVSQMLAAAEGNTSQTKHVKKLKKSIHRAATLILPCLVLGLMMSVATIVQPYWEVIFGMFKTGNYSLSFLLENWIILFAIADLLLLIGIGLGQTGLFPLLRLRCAIGLGFFFFLFYSRQEWLAVGAMSLLQAAMIFATLCTRFASTLLYCTLALAGGGAMIWLVWFKGIVF